MRTDGPEGADADVDGQYYTLTVHRAIYDPRIAERKRTRGHTMGRVKADARRRHLSARDRVSEVVTPRERTIPCTGDGSGVEALFDQVGGWLDGVGWWAYAIAPLIMAAVAVLPIPAEAPAVLNGMLFGPLAGTAVTWTGAMIGAVASFEIARAAGRPAAERWFEPEALARADRLVTRAGWSGLLIARFVPLIAFTALNWGAGFTPVRRWTFVWTTGVGIVPGAVLFTATGWGIGGLAGRLPWIALALAAVVAAWLVWRHRRRPDAATGTPPAHDSLE